MHSIFMDKGSKPADEDLAGALGTTSKYWQELIACTKELHPAITEEWHYSGAKFGWSFRLSDKKRVVLYLLPRDKFFKAAFVFGQKATDQVLQSDIAEPIKTELANAKVYAEGRGIRIDVKDRKAVSEIRKLVAIKLAN